MKHSTSAAEALPKDPVGPKDAAANDPPNEASDEARRNAQARALFTSLETVWPEMIRLTDDQRSGTTGRLAVRYEGTLRPLFSVTAKPRFRPAFSLLVMNDGQGGKVPYDPSRALAHLERATGMRAMAASLRALADVMDDDALHHGALAVDAGLAALKIARTTADNNPAFRAEVAHVLNEFKSMTAAARRAKAANADEPEATDEDAAEPAAKPDEK